MSNVRRMRTILARIGTGRIQVKICQDAKTAQQLAAQLRERFQVECEVEGTRILTRDPKLMAYRAFYLKQLEP